jgi:hypothetical protein
VFTIIANVRNFPVEARGLKAEFMIIKDRRLQEFWQTNYEKHFRNDSRSDLVFLTTDLDNCSMFKEPKYFVYRPKRV